MDELWKRRAEKKLPTEREGVRLLIERVTLAARAYGEFMFPGCKGEAEAREYIGRALRVVGRAIETNTDVCLNELKSGTATCGHNK